MGCGGSGGVASTLLDFGVKCKHPGKKAPGPIKPVSEPVKTFIEKERVKSSGEQYDTEYIIGYISKVPSYTFDLRGWPNGMNRQEFDRLWEMGFQDDVPIGKGHFWCDGHFAFALRAAKKMFKADK
ncbi:MAG: hypothetical protein PHH85_02400, partial [Candidatus Methanoperedens sp.]|nr:hypothetical protein [Candidatus Methanoperedens sp.]